MKVLLYALTALSFAFAVPEKSFASCTLEIGIEETIGPATLDWIDRSIKNAKNKNCSSILALINTPGGNLQSTRMIVELILNSDIPFLCLIHPSGAHAGSAGAIIMQACHVAGAISATNIGAATPISGGGQEMSDDLRKKVINDTRSWVEGLARLRGRSFEFAKEIVENAKAVSAGEAKKINAIDWTGDKKLDFLKYAENKTVKLSESKEAQVLVGDLINQPYDLRYKVMSLVTNPQIAYFLFMGSLGLLYFELTHPGMIAPGVLGALGLAVSLVAMHMLDVTTGGLLLILLGVVLMVLEAFVTSFGILGAGGVVAFFLGSLFLFDPAISGFSLSLSTIIPTTILLGLLMIGIAYLAMSTRRVRSNASFDALTGHKGSVSFVNEVDGLSGQVEINGEIWGFKSEVPLKLKQEVIVTKHEGFTLHVKPHHKEA